MKSKWLRTVSEIRANAEVTRLNRDYDRADRLEKTPHTQDRATRNRSIIFCSVSQFGGGGGNG